MENASLTTLLCYNVNILDMLEKNNLYNNMNKNEMLSYTEEKEELNMGFKRNYIQSYLHWQF
jgi:hypothetical protein